MAAIKANPNIRSYSLKIALTKIARLFISPIFGPTVFESIKQTNVFTKFPYDGVAAFVSFLEARISQDHGKVKNCDELLRIINFQFAENFSGLYYYLAAFDSIIPDSRIQDITAYCIENKSIAILYYCLLQYKNILDSSLSEDEKSLKKYCLSNSLYKELQA